MKTVWCLKGLKCAQWQKAVKSYMACFHEHNLYVYKFRKELRTSTQSGLEPWQCYCRHLFGSQVPHLTKRNTSLPLARAYSVPDAPSTFSYQHNT